MSEWGIECKKATRPLNRGLHDSNPAECSGHGNSAVEAFRFTSRAIGPELWLKVEARARVRSGRNTVYRYWQRVQLLVLGTRSLSRNGEATSWQLF